MKKLYAIGDIHGRSDLLVKALREIEKRNPDGEYKIVFTGDYVDRGPFSKQVIDILMTPPKDGSDRICLQGNHESMMLECAGSEEMNLMMWWCENGGDWTLKSYEGKVLASHMKWLRNLPSFHETKSYVFVHAYAPKDDVDLDGADKDLLQWTCYNNDDGRGYRGKHVVHGHVQSKDHPKTIGDRTNIDAFAWYTGALAVALFDDDIGGPPVNVFFVTGVDGMLQRQMMLAQ